MSSGVLIEPPGVHRGFALNRHAIGSLVCGLPQGLRALPKKSFALGGRLGIEIPFAPHVGFRGFDEALRALTFDRAHINRIPVCASPEPHASVGAGVHVFF